MAGEEVKKENTDDVEMKDESKPVEKDTTDNTGAAAGASMNSKQKSDEAKLVGAKAKAKWVMEEIKKHDTALYKEHGTGLATGNYEIIGLVTHKGRSVDGGHYIGWVHASGDDWLKCDDDIVTEVTVTDILDLAGGGDWPSAYLAFYRRLEVGDIQK